MIEKKDWYAADTADFTGKSMGSFFQILVFVILGMAMLWFGYTIFFRAKAGGRSLGLSKLKKSQEPSGERIAGDPQTCPVCSAKLEKGILVKSSAFPSFNGKDRFMHIMGCVYCLEGNRPRICPVCGTALKDDEYLISRIFERPGRSHVHVIGCKRCRGIHAMN
jgi:predicted nucleic acid-binding Zn ribbon protein